MQETSEHTKSYYAATTNWQTDYPVLAGEHRCGVAVFGAGFTWFANPALALGMLYYRLREIL